MRQLNLKNAAVDFVRYAIAVVALIAWSGALAQTTAEDYVRSGIAWSHKRDFDRAIADYNQALSNNPQYAEAYSNRGFAWLNKLDYDRAIADYTQALRINPQLAGAYNNRGIAWGNKGRLHPGSSNQSAIQTSNGKPCCCPTPCR
jgi:tetratricopeptide (TPR) repeat protein